MMATSNVSIDQAGGAAAGLTRRFTGLWIAWAGLLAAAMLAGNLGAGHGAPLATALRMGSSVALVVTGWVAWAVWREGSSGRFALAIAIGMTLGAIGDFFNAGLLDFVGLSNGVLGGIAAFGLGHIAYIAGTIDLAKRSGLVDRSKIGAAVIAWQLVGLVGWYFVVMLGSENRDLVWPALPYSLLLAGTAGVTCGLALQDRRLGGLALGGALFLASDLILAFGLFRGRFDYQTECVWLTYGPGQMLIVFSTIAAAAVVHGKASAARV
jgi:hypothetical protein